MKNLDELFPNRTNIAPGTWSTDGIMIELGDGNKVEIGLYREPQNQEEYAGTLTLHVFYNDVVVLCKTISENK